MTQLEEQVRSEVLLEIVKACRNIGKSDGLDHVLDNMDQLIGWVCVHGPVSRNLRLAAMIIAIRRGMLTSYRSEPRNTLACANEVLDDLKEYVK